MSAGRLRSLSDEGRASLVLRLERRSQPTAGGCVDWTGALDRSGYGKIKVFGRDGIQRTTGAHRAAWLAHRGDIAGDLVIDHLCRNRTCINVLHLELVTVATNTLRGDHSQKSGRSGKRQDQPLHACGSHGREDGYVRLHRDGYARWECRICRRARVAAWRDRQRAA